LPSRGIHLKIDIVGLGLKHDPHARKQLDCIAKSSGGKYYDADTSAQLIDSISHSVSKAISGTVITPGVAPGAIIKNTDTPPELIPILPAGKLIDEKELRENSQPKKNRDNSTQR